MSKKYNIDIALCERLNNRVWDVNRLPRKDGLCRFEVYRIGDLKLKGHFSLTMVQIEQALDTIKTDGDINTFLELVTIRYDSDYDERFEELSKIYARLQSNIKHKKKYSGTMKDFNRQERTVTGRFKR